MKASTLRFFIRQAVKRPQLVPPLVRGAAKVYRHDPAKGILAGLAGGLIGSIVMTEFQRLWTKTSEAVENDNSGEKRTAEQPAQEKEDSTMRAAGKIAELAGRELSTDEKKKYGMLVHYVFGTAVGAVYGEAMELTGARGVLVPGLAFGAALFALADEVAVPAMGLSEKPTESPISSHAFGLASHLVYGLSTEIARRGVRAAMR